MPVTEQRPITGIVETLRELPGEWDDRRGEEFDRLSSDERVAIQRKRRDHLATVGLSIITAILDHGWRPIARCLGLVESAYWARGLERTKPNAQGAIKFLGMFVKWYREHTDQLPPDAPVLGPLNVHLTSYRPEDVTREDFTKSCEAIAWLMETTTKQGLPIVALGSGSSKQKQKRPAWDRLTLRRSSDGSDHSADLDGKRFRIRGDAAFKMLDVLQQKKGERVKAAVLQIEINQRPDRVLKLLDKRLQRIIDPPKKGGVGYAML